MNLKKQAAFLLLLTCGTYFSNAQYVARHAMSATEYQNEFNKYSGTEKMRLADVSVYNSGGKETYAALWNKDAGPVWSARHAMSEADYQTAATDMSKQGYRPGRITAANIGGQVRFACIYYKTTSAFEARHNLSAAAYQTEFNNWTGKGYRLVEVCGYNRGGQETYAAVWEKSAGPAAIARHAMSGTGYQSEFNTNTGKGYGLVRVSAWEINGQDRYAAIWEKPAPGGYARHFMNSQNYQAEFDNHWYQGHALKHVCAYNVGGQVRFAALWTSGSGGMKDNDIATIDQKVNQYMQKSNIPGLSIAVMKNGRLVFAKGYGVANKSNGDLVSPYSLFRIASVSKPITATAVMRLVQDGKVKLTDPLFGSNGILGDVCTASANCKNSTNFNKITVQSCLEHTTGWTQDAVWANYNMSPSEITLWAAQNYDQPTAPGAHYQYINFDYLLLSRVIEKKSGMSYENYVKTYILKPTGVTKMQTGADAESAKAPNEVTYYADNNNGNPYDLKLTRMNANGGWIASPIDLLRFMTGVDGEAAKPDVLNSTSLTTMYTASTATDAGTYAKGWISDADKKMHNGCMPGTLAHLGRFKNGVSVAVTINTRPQNDDCHWNGMYPLAQSIAESTTIAWPNYDLF